jgi:hypothetical protein
VSVLLSILRKIDKITRWRLFSWNLNNTIFSRFRFKMDNFHNWKFYWSWAGGPVFIMRTVSVFVHEISVNLFYHNYNLYNTKMYLPICFLLNRSRWTVEEYG